MHPSTLCVQVHRLTWMKNVIDKVSVRKRNILNCHDHVEWIDLVRHTPTRELRPQGHAPGNSLAVAFSLSLSLSTRANSVSASLHSSRVCVCAETSSMR